MEVEPWQNAADSRCFKLACNTREFVYKTAGNWADLNPQHKGGTLSVLIFFDGHAKTATYEQVYDSDPSWFK